MPINQLEFRAPQDRAIERRAKEGGGKFGTVAGLGAGAALGGMAAAAVPGAAPAAIAMGAVGGAGAGASLGGLVGEKVKPSTQGSTAIERRIVSQAPQPSASQTLRDSLAALGQAPDPIKREYGPPLAQSYLAALKQEGGGRA